MMLEALEEIFATVYLVQMSDEFADICKQCYAFGRYIGPSRKFSNCFGQHRLATNCLKGGFG